MLLTRWLPRLILTVVTILFATICLRFMSDPVGAAVPFGLATTSSLGATTLRVSMGGFPITLSLITLYCLVKSRFTAGLSIVAVIMSVILAVRVHAGLTGNIMAEQNFVIYAEAVFLTLSLLGLYFQTRPRQATGA
jgi:hypothetical protein